MAAEAESSRGPVAAGDSQAKPMPPVRPTFTLPPKVVLIAGTVLSACAGMVNAICYLQLGSFVSHVSGTVTKVGMRVQGIAVGRDTAADLDDAIGLVVSFIAGAAVCGLMAGRYSLKEVHFRNKLYGLALIGNALLLASTIGLADFHMAKYIAAIACGLQNGMCTMHLGAICRTTHVTGLATDLGTTLGRLLGVLIRSKCLRNLDAFDRAEAEVVSKRLKVYLLLGGGFLSGGFLGAWFAEWGIYGLAVPMGISFVLGVTYFVCHETMQKQLLRRERSLNPQKVEEVERALERTVMLLHELSDQTPDNPELDSMAQVLRHLETTISQRYREGTSS